MFDFDHCVEAFESGLDVSRAFDHSELLDVTEQLYATIPVEVRTVDYQPYCNVHDMFERVSKEGIMYISSLHPPSYWSLEMTIKTRAIHDWYAHLVPQNDFSWEGEVKAFHASLAHYPKSLHWLLYSEVVLQVPQLILYGNVEQKIVYCRDGEPLLSYEPWRRRKGYAHETKANKAEYHDYVQEFIAGSGIVFPPNA